MQNLELILEENLEENTHLDGLCVLYTVPCEPLTIEPPPSAGLMSPGVMGYIDDLNTQLGVPSPTATPVEYDPVPITPEVSSYLGQMSEQMGINSSSITPTTSMNDGLTGYLNQMNEQMGVPSPTITPQDIIGYQPAPINPELTSYVNTINTQMGINSGPATPTFSVPSPSFDAQNILDNMQPYQPEPINQDLLSYVNDFNKNMGISSPPTAPVIEPEPLMPNLLDNLPPVVDFGPKFEPPRLLPKDDLMGKPLFDNTPLYKEPSFHMPEPLKPIRILNTGYQEPFEPIDTLKFETPEIDLTPKYGLIKPLKFDKPIEPIIPDFEIPDYEPPKFELPEIGIPPKFEPIIPRTDFNPIGTFSNFNKEINFKSKSPNPSDWSFGNISIPLDLSEDIPELDNKKYNIHERYDFGGHGSGKKSPHLSYDIKTNDTKIGWPRPLGKQKDFISLGSKDDFNLDILGKPTLIQMDRKKDKIELINKKFI